MQSNPQIKHSQQISQTLWHNLIPQNFLIPTIIIQLTSSQITQLIQLNSPTSIHFILTPSQNQQLQLFINSTPNNKVFIKVNGRTPKDLPHINRQVTTPQQIIQMLHSSQYILQGLNKNQPATVIVRQFLPELSLSTNIYDIYVRSGFIIAIGQKYCNHIQLQQLNDEQIDKIIDVVQIIMPAITIISPKNSQLNSFLVSAYSKGNTIKITSISQYPPYDTSSYQIFSSQQLQTYYTQITQESLHKQQRYEQNQGVIPLFKTIKKKEDIKHYDMGQYQIGCEIDDQDKMKQWKEFIQQAHSKVSD